jgi:hypothetical protein
MVCRLFLSSVTLRNTSSVLSIGSTDLIYPSPAPNFKNNVHCI